MEGKYLRTSHFSTYRQRPAPGLRRSGSWRTRADLEVCPTFEDRLQHLSQGMVDYTVAERRCRNQARLGIAYGEATVGAGRVRPIPQLALQPDQLRLQVQQKCRHVRTSALARRRAPRRQPQVGKGDQLRPETAHALHDRLATDFCQPPTVGHLQCRGWWLVAGG